MINFIKNIFCVSDITQEPEISEPVKSIIEATKDVDRWTVMTHTKDSCGMIHKFTDVKRQKLFVLTKPRMGNYRFDDHFSFANTHERNKITEAFSVLLETLQGSQKRSIAEYERRELMQLYCGEGM